ncbi:hypothetical protein C8R45DRAFT_942590 [Mycena sanguinolenta]|nr:hypothetical protein C8R45DRAFT_942590 [Mycena sanguinolenta]
MHGVCTHVPIHLALCYIRRNTFPSTAFVSSAGGFSNYFPAPSCQAADIPAYLASIGDEYSGMYDPNGRGFPRHHFKWEVFIVNGLFPTVEVTYSMAEIPSGLTLKYEVENMPTKQVHLTSSDIDSLRVIDLIVHDRVQVEAILDQGSEITVMSKEVWEHTVRCLTRESVGIRVA